MKYAISNNRKILATKGANGLCPCCSSEMIAKCGNVKVWHWAHKGKQHCDLWWENETEWHRNWKKEFPIEWQERVYKDKKGEKHIADICTDDELVIEFQHSAITSKEMQSRENFYKNMVWVVDSARLKRDRNRFIKSRPDWIPSDRVDSDLDKFSILHAEDTFNKHWISSRKPVFFDFGTCSQDDCDCIKNKCLLTNNKLWCLFPASKNHSRYIFCIDKNLFVEKVKTDDFISYLQDIYRSTRNYEKERINHFLQKQEQYRKESEEQKTKKLLDAVKEVQSYRKSQSTNNAIFSDDNIPHPACKLYKQYITFTSGELHEYVDHEVPDGDWIFGCNRRIWQSILYWRFIKNQNKRFCIEQVNDWLEHNGCLVPDCVVTLWNHRQSSKDLIPANLRYELPWSWKTLRIYFDYLCSLGMLIDCTFETADDTTNNRWYKVLS